MPCLYRNPQLDAVIRRMHKILLNGEPREIAEGSSVSDLLSAAHLADRKVAVEINREIVPRSLHAHRIVLEGDQVEIVRAMGGG